MKKSGVLVASTAAASASAISASSSSSPTSSSSSSSDFFCNSKIQPFREFSFFSGELFFFFDFCFLVELGGFVKQRTGSFVFAGALLGRRMKFLLVITISASVFLFLGLLFLLCYLWYFLFNRSRTSPFDSGAPLRLQRFSYKELKSATNVFSEGNSIGKGGSGTVFRGILRDGKSVAIKKLDATSLQAEREFQSELQVLGSLRSPFVVTLLGYCVEKKKRFLVYEYMPNKCLQEILFGEGPGVPVLDWNQRFEIIVDIARAIAFLHLECDPPIIHGDVKPSNVLLSSDYRAEISDFGLSRIRSEAEFGVDPGFGPPLCFL